MSLRHRYKLQRLSLIKFLKNFHIYLYKKLLKIFPSPSSSVITKNIFAYHAGSPKLTFSFFNYNRKWYYFYSYNTRILFYCSSGLELMTTLILKKFLISRTRRKMFSYKITSQNLRLELRKYNKMYKASKHTQLSHTTQFLRGTAFAKFIHFYPQVIYLYGNLIQMTHYLYLLRKMQLITPKTLIYYYPWHKAPVKAIATEAALKRTYRHKMYIK